MFCESGSWRLIFRFLCPGKQEMNNQRANRLTKPPVYRSCLNYKRVRLILTGAVHTGKWIISCSSVNSLAIWESGSCLLCEHILLYPTNKMQSVCCGITVHHKENGTVADKTIMGAVRRRNKSLVADTWLIACCKVTEKIYIVLLYIIICYSFIYIYIYIYIY